MMEKQTKQRIMDIIRDAIENGVTAGVNLLICKDGEEIFYGEAGYADRENQIPIRRDTIFRLYSMTKPITATAVMMLMEQGKLELAQPVSDFLPGFETLTVDREGKSEPVKMPMTLRHLMNMTSGLTYGGQETGSDRQILAWLQECIDRMYGPEAVHTVEFADHVGRIPLAFDPDSSWQYGLSADILGAVVEVVSGMSYGEFLQKRLFDPLEMRDTGFWVPEQKQSRLAKAYETVGKDMIPYNGDNLVISNSMKTPPAFESGGAGLASTIDDYNRFAGMLLNGGSLEGRRILSSETVKFMTMGRLTGVQQDAMRRWVGMEGFTYSNLMRIMVSPEQASGLSCMGEYGWDGWLGCYFANFPNEQMSIVLMQQKKDAGTISMTRKIRNVLLSR